MLNKYIEHDDYIEGFTVRNNKSFLFDKEDFELIKNYLWKIKWDSNTVYTTINGKDIGFLKFIIKTNSPVRHINGNNSDNRKENLTTKIGENRDGKVYLNGYISIYMPEHPRAYDNGCVYEHILVAEKMLGRPLMNKECVHHKDKDRTNNSTDNLMVFKTEEDHILYHAYGECSLNDNGSYSAVVPENILPYYYNNRTVEDINNGIKDVGSITISTPIKKKRHLSKEICPVCKVNHMTKGANMCNDCRKIKQAKNVIKDRDLLKHYIRTMPFTKIGEMFNVKDNSIRKWCDKYNLPRRKNDILSYSDDEWELI